MRVFLSLFSFFLLSTGVAFEVPHLSAPVVDRADLLSRSTEQKINHALKDFRKRGGAQIALLTVPTLNGLTIEQASIQVVEKWKLGTEEGDDGILFMIAQKERRLRIEVGQGLEGVLTDAHAKRILDEAVTPLFRSRDFASGILVGLYQIARRTNPDISMEGLVSDSSQPTFQRKKKGKSSRALFWLFLLFFFIFGGRGSTMGFLLGSALGSSGRSGGGSFGGGGFSGGGGGFSGGGASGGW